ncbi:hypothetical protein [Aestuariivirga litoralis]|uniref:hypothetical protein n=1 Tax=Aestuariivirga litoralis TaxID=2650924 RepID=UPI0011B74500|nr:hypothetical protein [Aestuariivirga litoralis]
MYPSLKLSPLLTPTPHTAGRSKAELVERRLEVMAACDSLLKAIKATLPEDCEYEPPTPKVGDEARRAWRERSAIIEALRDEIAMEAMKITIEWSPVEEKREKE